MRKLFVFVLFACVIYHVSAQTNLNGTNTVSTSTTETSEFTFSLILAGGFFVGPGTYEINSKLSIGLLTGYILVKSFNNKDSNTLISPNSEMSIIPILGVGKYRLSDMGSNIKPYFGADAGIYLCKPNNSEKKTLYGLSPTFGFEHNLTKNIDLDINIKNTFLFKSNEFYRILGLYVGLNWKLN